MGQGGKEDRKPGPGDIVQLKTRSRGKSGIQSENVIKRENFYLLFLVIFLSSEGERII